MSLHRAGYELPDGRGGYIARPLAVPATWHVRMCQVATPVFPQLVTSIFLS